jgi:thiamine phosphate synthase YjbQ (UPF0047 family)
MTVESKELGFRTHREGEILDITDKTQRIVESSPCIREARAQGRALRA